MKIAFLSFYQGKVNRGVETFVAQVATRLGKHHEVKIFNGDVNVPFKKYRFGWRFYLDPQSLEIKKFTEKVLDNLDSQTEILIPVNGGWQSLFCRLWASRHQKKVVISGHSGIGWDDKINLWTRPDAFVALSNFQKKWAQRNSWGVRVEKIADGVDLEKFHPKVARAQTNLARPIILCVAALEADKRIHLVVEAVSKMSKGSLLVIGQGLLSQEIEKLGREKLLNRFQLLSIPHDKIPSYYTAADVFTMVPQQSESFGMVFLEAMAAGLPVVTADDPIRREIVGDAGLFIDPNETNKYTAALQSALGQKWGDSARVQAEKFSWDKIVMQYEKLFASL